MLGELKWTGLAMVEFKMKGNTAHLMEINGRIWGSLPLAVSSGMNFPAQLADMYLDDDFAVPPTVNTSYRRGTKARDLYMDIVWLISVLLGVKSQGLPVPSRRDSFRPCWGI